jgi:hypothetical protein
MTASNINIDDFINILTILKQKGHKMIDLDMLPDDNHPSMNKLVVHPVSSQGQANYRDHVEQPKSEIRNPEISTENNDIFNNNLFDL